MADDANGVSDVFVCDLATGRTVRASVDSAGREADGASVRPALSADATAVSFTSTAANLVGHDANAVPDVFVAGADRRPFASSSSSPI